MAASNEKGAGLLRRYATALSIQGADRFQVKAYRRAAANIEALPDDPEQLQSTGAELTRIPGVGGPENLRRAN